LPIFGQIRIGLSCYDEICVPEQDELSITLQVVASIRRTIAGQKVQNGFPPQLLARPLGSEASFAVSN